MLLGSLAMLAEATDKERANGRKWETIILYESHFLGWREKVSILILRTDYPKQRPAYAQIHNTYFLAAYSSSTYLV